MKEQIFDILPLLIVEFVLLVLVVMVGAAYARWKTRRRYRGRGAKIHVETIRETIDG